MAIFIVSLILCIVYVVSTWYHRPTNELYSRRQAEWFFREAFTTVDPSQKAVAFQAAMCWAGEKDYRIIREVFEELQEYGLL
jgi:hypothetical protein